MIGPEITERVCVIRGLVGRVSVKVDYFLLLLLGATHLAFYTKSLAKNDLKIGCAIPWVFWLLILVF